MGQDLPQQTGGEKKSAVGEIIEALKDNPSFLKWVKSIVVFAIGFQVVIFMVVVFMFIKISGVMGDRHHKFKSLERDLDAHIENFDKKFKEEQGRIQDKMKRQIADSIQRRDEIRKFHDNYRDFHSKGMSIMRENRENDTIDFYTRIHKNPERLKQLLDEKEKRMLEREEREETKAAQERLMLAQEEYRLQGLEADLKEEEKITGDSSDGDASLDYFPRVVSPIS